MLRDIAIVVLALIIIPFVSYIIGRYVTIGVLSAKKFFNKYNQEH